LKRFVADFLHGRFKFPTHASTAGLLGQFYFSDVALEKVSESGHANFGFVGFG